VLVITRFSEGLPDFAARAERALAVLAARPGYRGGSVGRSTDHDGGWAVVTRWDSVGSWRRALSSVDAKMYAAPLLALARDEPSTYEELLTASPGDSPQRHSSDRAADTRGERRSRRG